MKLFIKLICVSVLVSQAMSAWAQPSVQRLRTRLQDQYPGLVADFRTNMDFSEQASLLFKNGREISMETAEAWLRSNLELRQDVDSLVSPSTPVSFGNIRVKQLRQYFRGIPVEHGIINITAKSGLVHMMQFEFYPISSGLRTAPGISIAEAKAKAHEAVPARRYVEDNEKVRLLSGKLVIIGDVFRNNMPTLAYRFYLISEGPSEEALVYIDAADGRVLLTDHKGCSANKSAKFGNHNSILQDTAATENRVMLTDPKINSATQPAKAGNKDRVTDKVSGLPSAPEMSTANVEGTADTYVDGKSETYFNSGQRDIVTLKDMSNPNNPKYILKWQKDGHFIEVRNMRYKPNTLENIEAATAFVDNDNIWTTAEFDACPSPPSRETCKRDVCALDAYFNLSIVSDYWKKRHNRNSFDDKGAPILGFVHPVDPDDVQYYWNNAEWKYNKMFFGDGIGTVPTDQNPNPEPPAGGTRPQVAIDIVSHEFGHGVTQYTAGLVYRWESGALSEGFSDIWAACVTKFLKDSIPQIGGDKREWIIGEEFKLRRNPQTQQEEGIGYRDMGNPVGFIDNPQPAIYKGTYWKPGSFVDCRNPTENNDNCGVHTNSGVLNKWFYLITQGEGSISPIGFLKTERLAYLTLLNLTPNSGYQTVRNVSVNAAITLWGDGAEANIVRSAWIAVGVDLAVFDMINTPAFTTNNFSSIAVAKSGCIWAGTSSSTDGLYRYAESTGWVKATVLATNAIAQMVPDKEGGLWIAQYGRGSGAQAINGGINYIPDTAFSGNTFYLVSNGVATNNVRSIHVDTFRMNGSNPAVWGASLAQISGGVSRTGGPSYGLNATGNAFTKITAGIEQTSTTGGAQTIGGGVNEIWCFSPANIGNQNQIVRYDPLTRALLGFYDNSNVPELPAGFSAKAIYFDKLGKKWLGLGSGGLVVQDNANAWHAISPASVGSAIIPDGTIVNNNAIAGDRFGNVYIGTNKGLIFYNHRNVDSPKSYRRYTIANGLPSDNIRSIALDSNRYKLLVATDKGIIFFDQICDPWEGSGPNGAGVECLGHAPGLLAEVTTIANGNWSNPAIWSSNKVPDTYTQVTIRHSVQLDVDGTCYLLIQKPGASLNIQAGRKLAIKQGDGPPNITLDTQ